MKVLMGEHTHYDSMCQVGCHHLAQGLARRGNHVTYLSTYFTPFHFSHFLTSKKEDAKKRTSNWLSGGKTWEEGLETYVPFSFLPYARKPLLDTLWMAEQQAKWSLPNLPRKLRRKGPYDAFLIGDLRFIPMIEEVGAPITIFRLTDDVLGIPGTPHSAKHLLELALSKCDHVIVASQNLCHRLEEWFGFKKAIFMPNGVDLNHFSQEDLQEPQDLSRIPKPRVIYAGSIDERMDRACLDYCAKKLPEVSFVLIGPTYISLKSLKHLPNMHILGPRPYRVIPHYLSFCQAALIPFRKHRRIDSVSSIKLLQYLASGLPTVASLYRELEFQKPPIHLAPCKEEFAEQIQQALTEKPDRELYQQYARRYSWETNVSKILELIETHSSS